MPELSLADQARAALHAIAEQPGGGELLDRVVALLRDRIGPDFPDSAEEAP